MCIQFRRAKPSICPLPFFSPSSEATQSPLLIAVPNEDSYDPSVSLESIPFDVFLECIVPHIGVKEIGVLSLVSKGLNDFCSDNFVWKEMYLRTLRSVITDKSIHNYKWCWGGGDERFIPDFRIVGVTGRLSDRSSLCLPKELRNKITHPKPDLLNGYPRNAGGEETEMEKIAFSKDIRAQWSCHNRSLGLSTKCLCQNPKHYVYETLGKPEKCRGSKNYKALVLSKVRTKLKHKNDPIKKGLQKQITWIEEAMRRQKAGPICEIALPALQERYDKMENEQKKITTAISSIRERMRNQSKKK